MRAALALARRGLGLVAPNPAVGCVLVRPGPSGTEADGEVVGRGWTQPGGRPHAEAEALARAGPLAEGATAYVSLEPCAHVGKTPACVEALIRAGIARAAIAVEDPDPRVKGRGIERLRAAGVAVAVGVLREAASEINAGFFLRIQGGRPLVTLKLATTLDGRIATRPGASRWITGGLARDRAHLLRASHDGVLVGSGTVLADDPELVCRLPGLEGRPPVRVVLDRRLRLPQGAKLVASAKAAPLWLFTGAEADGARCRALAAAGVEVIRLPPDDDGPAAVLRLLGERGLTRLLVEGGGGIAAALLRAGLVDRIAWFRAPAIIGADGVPAVREFGLGALAEMPVFRRLATVEADVDLLETYRRDS